MLRLLEINMRVSEQEIFWFRRRSFVQAAAAFTAAGVWLPAHAQSRSNIVELAGDAQLNGATLRSDMVIQTGDVVQTGPSSRITFVIGSTSIHLRQNTLLKVERGESINFVSVMRLITGGMASVFAKGERRRVITPTLTAGIRGTGIYLESEPTRSYFCNCYGVIELTSGAASLLSTADYHDSYWASPIAPKDGKAIWPTSPRNHTDEELDTLARLSQQSTAWATMPVEMRKQKQAEKAGAYTPAR
jgi:hypothetical protein